MEKGLRWQHLCKDVSDVVARWDIADCNAVVFSAFMDIVPFGVDVFGASVK
jgi:hypothetical protein